MKRRPIIADQRAAIVAGAVLVFVGSLMLWDAYEGRGRTRPFALRLLPGG